jgi:hypothetical protein
MKSVKMTKKEVEKILTETQTTSGRHLSSTRMSKQLLTHCANITDENRRV